ncbi:MAG: dihydropteroate synthase [Methanoregulaceae archaeon]|nr:dihydropteroate synthase [Methanoregulaceae archaeon]
MQVISERINGLFTSVGKAIDRCDAKWVQDHAIHQIECGSQALDINVGPGREDGPAAMDWLVRTVQEVTDATLCLDTPGTKTMTAGLKAAKNKVIMNSTTAERKRMDALFPLCREYGADIICLTMDEMGIPNEVETRAELAMTMVTTAMEHEIMPDRIYLDPLILPIKAAQDQGMKVIKALHLFQSLSDPPIRTVVGLIFSYHLNHISQSEHLLESKADMKSMKLLFYQCLLIPGIALLAAIISFVNPSVSLLVYLIIPFAKYFVERFSS